MILQCFFKKNSVMEPEEIQDRDPVRVLLGPTAGGKTRLSLLLAERMGAEVVSVDSMQVYRGMDIGTAKVSREDRKRVDHHMIDVVDPEESFNAARFCTMARQAMAGIRRRGKTPLLVCGTPFYLKALLWGMFEGPGADPAIRRRLRGEAVEQGVESLHRRLERVDPEAAKKIDARDFKRIERALEVYELTGRPISERQGDFEGPPRFCTRIIGLHWPRRVLFARIERRVRGMIGDGLLEEVRAVRDRLGPQARQAVGYKEIIAYLEGRIGLGEAQELIMRNTRRFARDQAGWFKRFPVDRWFGMEEGMDFTALAADCGKALYR